MSSKSCKIIGYGHFVHINDFPVLKKRFNIIRRNGLILNYNKIKNLKQGTSPIGMCQDCVCNDFYFVGILVSAHYLDCCDETWKPKKFTNNKNIRNHIDSRIKIVFGIKEKSRKIHFEVGR